MWTLLTAAIAAATLAACTALAGSVRRRPVALLLPIGLSLMVALEAVVACALSPLRALARGPVLAVHLAFVLLAFAALARTARFRADVARLLRAPRALRRRDAAAVTALVGTLALALLAVALAYQPGNWDSMTYRLARVARWIANRSVEPYPTVVARQAGYPPGAEYVLAAWQVMSGSDRLASLLQWASWLAVALATGPLLRLAGASRRIALAGVVVTASIPMAVLQATGTQTDLVGSALAVALVAATVPFLHRTARFRAADGALLGALGAAALLTKATAPVAAFPFVACAAVVSARAARGGLLRAVAAAVLVAAAVAGPDAAIRLSDPAARAVNRADAAVYLYAPLGEFRARATNVARGLARHLPAPAPLREALGIEVPRWCAGSALPCDGREGDHHEDYAGNPLHALLAAALAGVAVVRRRSLPPRALGAVAAVAAAWLLFQLTFRHNEWITRLETPTYVLGSLSLAALAGGGARGRGRERVAVAAAAVVAAFALPVAWGNTSRPLWPALTRPYPVYDYYASRPAQRFVDEVALRAAVARRCTRLGMYVGGDSYDYPITWRAMRLGIETRHVLPGDPWPCVVMTDGTVHVPPGAPWVPEGDLVVYRNLLAAPDVRPAAGAP